MYNVHLQQDKNGYQAGSFRFTLVSHITSDRVHNVKKLDNTGEDLEDLISIGMDKEGYEISLIDILGTESDDVADKQLKIEKSKIYIRI